MHGNPRILAYTQPGAKKLTFVTYSLEAMKSVSHIFLLAILACHAHALVNLTLAIVAPDHRNYSNNDLGSKASLKAQSEIVPFILQDLNERLAHPRGVHFEIKEYDTKQKQLGSVEAAIKAQREGKALGLLGEWASVGTIPAAWTTTSFNVPMCSGTATSDLLSNKEDFPLFMRALSSDGRQGAFIAQTVVQWNWTQVNVLVANDAYGLSVQAAFREEARRLNITIERSIIVQDQWTSAEYQSMVDRLVVSSTRVVIAIMLPNLYIQVAQAMKSRGLIKSFTFIGGDALVTTMDSATSLSITKHEERVELFDGLFFAWPAEVPRSSARYDLMLQRWVQAGNPESTFKTAYALFGASCIEILVAGWIDIIDKHGIGAAVNRTYMVKLSDFLEPRDTITGRAVFDKNGDRDGSFELWNVQNATSMPVLYSENGVLTQLREPMYPNRSNKIPPWQATYTLNNPSVGMPGVITILVLTGVTMASVVIGWAYLMIHRDTRRVKHLGISFTSVLCLGLLLALSSPFQMVGVPTIVTCASQYWTIFLGYSLCLASLWIRSYRIRKVFDNRVLSKTTSVQTRALVQRMLVLPMLQAVLLLSLQLVSPLVPTRLVVNGLHVEFFCLDSTAMNPPAVDSAAQSKLTASVIGSVMFYVAGGLDGYHTIVFPNRYMGTLLTHAPSIVNTCRVLLAMLAWVSVKLRSVHTAFKDTLFIAYTIHNLTFTVIIAAVLITLFDRNSVILFYVKSCAILYSCLVVFVCMVARHAVNVKADSKTEASSRPSGALETRMIESMAPGAGGTTQIKAAFIAIIPVKFCGWVIRKWQVCQVMLYAKTGVLCVFPTTAGVQSDPIKGHGLTYRLRKCVVDTEPDDEPPGAVALSCAGTDAIVLMFPSIAERDKWSGAFLQVATPKATASQSGSKNGLARRSSSAKFGGLSARAATISVTSGVSFDDGAAHVDFAEDVETEVVVGSIGRAAGQGSTSGSNDQRPDRP
ncbi:periplasmic binding protein-like I [Catenaria anguillulae PL171]|uniref:Periplasmic binding protein-like I n=1 Tax=Catenaria anguillulae PL171 TaxID=765915 RepID=A0A1Y2HN98_9FUNG|nr:periplasmic binding protein-like I [Catenaria anguillulae PL171]